MSIFPTKILLATDGSRDAELAATTDLANTTNSELHLVTVAGGRAYHTEIQDEVETTGDRPSRYSTSK